MPVSYDQLAATATQADDPIDALLKGFTSDEPAEQVLTALLCVPQLGRGCRTWVGLAEVLLVVAKRGQSHLEDMRATEADQIDGVIAGLRTAATGVLAHSPSNVFADLHTCQSLVVEFDRAVADLGAPIGGVLAATAFAHAIDDAHHGSFENVFSGNLEHRIRPNRAYPVASYDPSDEPRLISASINTAPGRQPSLAPPGTDHLRLGTDLHSTYTVVLDWDIHGRLGPLSDQRLRIATCHPNLSLGEFSLETTDTRFRNKGPSDLGHVGVVCAQLATATEHGANIAIVPEYCLCEDDRGRVQAWLRDNHGPLRLVIGGSSEARDDDHNRVNQYCLWVCADGCEPLHKCGSKIFQAEVLGLIEDVHVDRPPIVRIFRTPRWTLAVLLCRDAASEELVDLIGETGANLLLVPSLTDRIGTIADVVSRLTTSTQAFTAVAIGPATFTLDLVETVPPGIGPEAVFDGPYEAIPSVLAAPIGGDRGAGRGVWIYDAYDRTATWVDTPL